MKLQDIAKAVRSDIRAAIKAGELPEGTKVSVVCDSYSMGCALRTYVRAVPGWMTVTNEAYVRFAIENPAVWSGAAPEHARHRHSAEARALLAAVDAIVSKYHTSRRHDGGGGDDIVHENFHKNVDFSHEASDYKRVEALVRRKMEQGDRRHVLRAECVPA